MSARSRNKGASGERDVSEQPHKRFEAPVMMTVVVPGPVVPYQRPNSFRGKRLTPTKTREYRKHVRACVKPRALDGWPMGSRFQVHIWSYRSTRHVYDLDNVAKAILDALNGVTFTDDGQVDELLVRRELCAPGRERVEIAIYQVVGKMDVMVENPLEVAR